MMESNATLFNTSAESFYNETAVPLHVSYLRLFTILLGVLVMIPTLIVLIIIVKNRKLKAKRTFLIHLFIADFGNVLSCALSSGTIIILYLVGITINYNCSLLYVPGISTSVATRILFLSMNIDRFIHVAFPFSYKSIMTTKVRVTIVCSIWLYALLFPVLSVVRRFTKTVPALGACEVVHQPLPNCYLL